MKEGSGESGFSYIDVMIATTILLVGILALVGAMTSAIVASTQGQQQVIAKQYATSTIEAIFSARDLNNLGFSSIGNVGDSVVPGAIFPTGVQPIFNAPGVDGIVGTADDGWGPDGIQGTADDIAPVPGFTRQITITDIPDPDRPKAHTMRRIDVTIFYSVGNLNISETVSTYIANYNKLGG